MVGKFNNEKVRMTVVIITVTTIVPIPVLFSYVLVRTSCLAAQ